MRRGDARETAIDLWVHTSDPQPARPPHHFVNKRMNSSESVTLDQLTKLIDAGTALPTSQIKQLFNLDQETEQLNAWIKRGWITKIVVGDHDLFVLANTKPRIVQKKQPVAKPFKSPVMSLTLGKAETFQPGQGLSKLRHALQTQKDDLTDQLRQSVVLLKNPIEDLDRVTSKWKTATQKAIRDFKTKAIACGVTADSLKRKVTWDDDGNVKRPRLETPLADGTDSDDEVTTAPMDPTMQQLLASFGVHSDVLVELLDYDVDNDCFAQPSSESDGEVD